MRAVVQRCKWARVSVDEEVVGSIDAGLCVLLGAGDGDSDADLRYTIDKVANLRIFEDDAGKMNRSVLDVNGGVLAISQFTLYGDARKGRRPSFVKAMEPTRASELYEAFVDGLRVAGVTRVETGRFRASMNVELCNHGPVTIMLDSQKLF